MFPNIHNQTFSKCTFLPRLELAHCLVTWVPRARPSFALSRHLVLCSSSIVYPTNSVRHAEPAERAYSVHIGLGRCPKVGQKIVNPENEDLMLGLGGTEPQEVWPRDLALLVNCWHFLWTKNSKFLSGCLDRLPSTCHPYMPS